MVRFNTISALAFTSLLPYMVSAECLDPLTGASITEGAWNMNGVNSTWQPARLDDSNINTQNPGWTVPDAALWYVCTTKCFALVRVDTIDPPRNTLTALLTAFYYSSFVHQHQSTGHTQPEKWANMGQTTRPSTPAAC